MPRGKNRKFSEEQEDHSQKAYKGIRRMLYHKELVPGQKVSCRELTERFNMSLTPVIQALKYMELRGFVRHVPNKGYYMTPFSLTEVEEIYELRELLEPSLIPDSINRLDEEGEASLKTALEAHLLADREVYLNERLFKNVEFHLALASLANKPIQLKILRDIFDLLLLKYGGSQWSASAMDLVDQEHKKTFDCVVSGDVTGAKEILSLHIAAVKEQVLGILRRILAEREGPEF